MVNNDNKDTVKDGVSQGYVEQKITLTCLQFLQTSYNFGRNRNDDSIVWWKEYVSLCQLTKKEQFFVTDVSWCESDLLESSLTMLTLVSDPALVTDAGTIDTFPREAVFVACFRRRGFREEHQVKYKECHQTSSDIVGSSKIGRASCRERV